MRKPIIAITMGDPGGIGPEVILKALSGFVGKGACYFVLVGIPQPFDFIRREYKISIPIQEISSLNQCETFDPKKIQFLDITNQADHLYKTHSKKNLKKIQQKSFEFEIGKISAVNACMAYASLQVATLAALKGNVEAIVTAPLNKTSIRFIEPKFSGHTEYLAKASKVSKFAMMFVHERLKVTLVTIHVDLKNVSKLITKETVFEKIRLTNHFLRSYFNIAKPKIAVCALNPHGKETGEEDEVYILPAVKQARMRKIEAVGPLSADQIFHEAYEGRFDAVISMYHDQGLAPFKMIAFHDGVNVTLGLPFIRTSPDHGTAFDIAYQNRADHRSFAAALKLAERLIVSNG